jgi:membrane associated rhomboid family serine protease
MMVARYLPALMEVKPAVTLAVGGSLVGYHFHLLGTIPYMYGRTIQDVCLMPGAILYDVELLRFVTGVVTHFSDYHLYWALASLAAKGLALEPRIGSKNFGTLLLALTVLTSVVTVVLSFSMYNLLGDHGWMKNCYVGEPRFLASNPVHRTSPPAKYRKRD